MNRSTKVRKLLFRRSLTKQKLLANKEIKKKDSPNVHYFIVLDITIMTCYYL